MNMIYDACLDSVYDTMLRELVPSASARPSLEDRCNYINSARISRLSVISNRWFLGGSPTK